MTNSSANASDTPLPCRNGVAPFWAALRALDPALTYIYAFGMLGGLAMTDYEPGSFSPREAAPAVANRLPALGYRATPLPEDELRREAALRRSLALGRPVPWFGERLEGIVVAETPEGWRVRTACAACETVPPDGLADALAFRVSRAPRPIGPRSSREVGALASSVATALTRGLAAYREWEEALRERPRRERQRDHRTRAERWLDARRGGAAFLREVAGRQRSPYAVRLNRAARLFEREAEECLAPLAELLNGRRPTRYSEAADLLAEAGELAEEALEWACEAALIALRLPPPLRSTLLQPPDQPLAGTALFDMIYLARAGTPEIRLLAARRLRGAEHPQAAATRRLLGESRV